MGELIARLNLTAVEREQLGGFVGRIKAYGSSSTRRSTLQQVRDSWRH